LEPERNHSLTVGKLVKVAQEDFANQCRCLNSGLTHTDGIRVIHLRLEKAQDEWEKDLIEESGPFVVVAGDQLGRQKSPLESGDGMVSNITAWVDTLAREGLEDWIPVGGPG